MRFAPKFIPTIQYRPKIFSINSITAYVGGTRKVWGRIVQDEKYKSIFVKVDPVGLSYSFVTELTREKLQELYLNDIKSRITEAQKRRHLMDKLAKKSILS